MGLTFKENCADIRNSGVKSIITNLKKYSCNLELHDPWANKAEVKKIFGMYPNSKVSPKSYDAVIIAVAHSEFKTLGLAKIKSLCKSTHIIFDLKNIFNSTQVDFKL